MIKTKFKDLEPIIPNSTYFYSTKAKVLEKPAKCMDRHVILYDKAAIFVAQISFVKN